MAGDAVSIAVAARLLGISPDRLRQLIRAGHVISPARGQVSLASAMRGYAATLRSSAAAPSSAALARSQRIKAEILRAETAARRADLVETDRAVATIAAVADLAVDHVRDMARPAALRGFPPDVAGRIRDEAAEVITKIQTAAAAAHAALISGKYEEIAE